MEAPVSVFYSSFVSHLLLGYSDSGNRILKVVTTEVTQSSVNSMNSPYGQSAASTIRDAREREKKEMSDLNDKLASYIEKVPDPQ